MNEPIIAQFMLPITEKETVQELMQKGVDWGKTIGAIEELEKIKEEIKDLDLEFFDEDYRAGVARGIMEFNKILNKRITELKGE